MAPSIRSSGTTSRASWPADARSASLGRGGAAGVEADGEDVGAGDAETVGRVAPADEHRLAGRARDGALDDARRCAGRGPSRRPSARVSVWPTVEAEPLGEGRRDDRRAAGVEGRERGRPVAGDEPSRPSAAMSAPTTAAASVRVPSSATSNVAMRADPGDAGDGAGEVGHDALVRRDRPDGGQDELARDDVGDPAGGGGAGVLADAAEGDDHRQPDGQAAERSASSGSRSRTTALRASRSSTRSRSANGAPAIRAMAGSRNGMSSVADEQDRVDGERRTTPAPPAGRGRMSDADQGDGDEHGGEPAQPGACARRAGRAAPGAPRPAGCGWPDGPARGPRRGSRRRPTSERDSDDVERQRRVVER